MIKICRMIAKVKKEKTEHVMVSVVVKLESQMKNKALGALVKGNAQILHMYFEMDGTVLLIAEAPLDNMYKCGDEIRSIDKEKVSFSMELMNSLPFEEQVLNFRFK